MSNEKIFDKVFVGGDRNIGRVPDKVAKWLDDCMERRESILISDENSIHVQAYLNAKKYGNVTVYHSEDECRCNLGNWETKYVPDVSYSNEKNIALVADCDCGMFVYDRGDLAMRMAVNHLRAQGKPIFVYRTDIAGFKITRRKGEVK